MAALQAFLDVDHSRASTWDRLPTPVHFDRQSPSLLLSPPLSRATSPRPSPLAVNTDSPSNESISPLPSPVARHVGKKTSAFFGSPFERTPSPPRRASTPEPSVERVEPEPERPQTANSSFFFAKGSATPTPPPSIHSDGDGSAPKRLPPIARFFPSRAPVDHDPDTIDGLNNHQTPSRRGFVTLEDSTSSSDSSVDACGISEVPISPHGSLSDILPPDSPTPRVEVADPLEMPRETATVSPPPTGPTEGSIVGTDVPLALVRELGTGSFSCVWLALDIQHKLERNSGVARLRSQSIARKRKDRVVQGLKPQMASGASLSRSQSIFLAQRHGEGATAETDEDGEDSGGDGGELVAVKMMDRAMCDANDRTRISFVREVEVLRHISHPSIVSYLHSFTTPTHHCLVLEALLGGELFELLDQSDNHSRMTEPLLRRIFGELCQAVGWMHGVGLVHRDLKLENILLTANPFLASPIKLASLPSPLVKLTDFGLARFIDPAAPALVTRCGSEAYAAPEIVTGKTYDGRQTDAWACGVVLYALATRTLPFARADGERDTRRAYMVRIAQGEYVWPAARLATSGLQSVTARLLVRDPEKRARVVELWDEEWMRSEGAPPPPLSRAGPEAGGRLMGKDIPSVAKQEL